MSRGSGKDAREAFAIDRIRLRMLADKPKTAPEKDTVELFASKGQVCQMLPTGEVYCFKAALENEFGTSPVFQFSSGANAVNNKYLVNSGGSIESDDVGELCPSNLTIRRVTFVGSGGSPSGTVEFRKNTLAGPPALSVTLSGSQFQADVVDFDVAVNDVVNCYITGASGVGKPVVKMYV